MRKRIFEIIEKSDSSDKLGMAYDIFMLVAIFASILPLAFKEEYFAFDIIDKVCVALFIIDYILRWVTADFKFNNKSIKSFLRYPFSPMAIIDLISILPSLTIVNSAFKMLRIMRLFRALRVFRVFKVVRYSKNLQIISNVINKSKRSLIVVGTISFIYILISALIILNVEPDSFNSFFDAVYWATISLTTMGYGDIYPVTTVGRIVTMVSSFFGIAIIALPSGIIAGEFMNEIRKSGNDSSEN